MASVARGLGVCSSPCVHISTLISRMITRLKDLYFLLPDTNATCVSMREECLSEREDK